MQRHADLCEFKDIEVYKANCNICPPLRKETDLLLGPSVPDYLDFVSQYKNDPATLEVAKTMKTCVDNKLTAEDKANAQSLLDKIDAAPSCR
ncbi:hypothetical protein U0070_022020 [Myodes glareolus]|uniref:Uncharacterized protein n=1 Tax=Myodes glareolus TaxID=447135 RepID=A0AAW0HCS2_MYOGA